MTMPRALARARAIVPGAIVERNHLFRQVFRAQGAAVARQRAFADPLGAIEWPALTTCSDGLAIGMVDTPVQETHAAFAGKSIETLSLRSAGRRPASSAHGTAVAALLLGHGEQPGLVPGARLIAADAFHRREGADMADAFDLVAALDALVARQVPVINVSLAGPPNSLLDAAGTALRQRGVILVAATGNDGAASGPRYPAAYGWAVAVTAVDDAQAVYDRAGRGDHVAFAAPGVRLRAPTSGGTGVVTGTSFATPFVTAAIALLASVDAETQPLELLITAARDLGGPGRDPIYGHGLLRMPRGCSVADLRE
jgi:subtilisin family serine protease